MIKEKYRASLETIAAALESTPDKVDPVLPGVSFSMPNLLSTDPLERAPECGTAACVAGHLVLMHPEDFPTPNTACMSTDIIPTMLSGLGGADNKRAEWLWALFCGQVTAPSEGEEDAYIGDIDLTTIPRALVAAGIRRVLADERPYPESSTPEDLVERFEEETD